MDTSNLTNVNTPNYLWFYDIPGVSSLVDRHKLLKGGIGINGIADTLKEIIVLDYKSNPSIIPNLIRDELLVADMNHLTSEVSSILSKIEFEASYAIMYGDDCTINASGLDYFPNLETVFTYDGDDFKYDILRSDNILLSTDTNCDGMTVGWLFFKNLEDIFEYNKIVKDIIDFK